MGLVIRCWWLPPRHLPIEQRMMEALGVIRQPELASIFGAGWFKGGRTKKAALSRPVNLENITPKAPPWRRVSMTDVPPHNDIYYQLGLWNGLDRPASCSFSITLYEPALDPRRLQIPGLETDTIIISGPELALLESTRSVRKVVAEIVPRRRGFLELVGA